MYLSTVTVGTVCLPILCNFETMLFRCCFQLPMNPLSPHAAYKFLEFIDQNESLALTFVDLGVGFVLFTLLFNGIPHERAL